MTRTKTEPGGPWASICKRFMGRQQITSAELGEILGISDSAVRKMLLKPERAWTVGQIQSVAHALGIPNQAIIECFLGRN